MSNRNFHSARRFMFGGVAASLGLASVFGPSLTPPAVAQPVEGPGPIQPNAIAASSTYEACTPYFGLTKDNADLLSFDVNNVDNALTPAPVIGTDIVAVLTVTDGTQSIDCIPDLGWSDESTWLSNYVDGNETGFLVEDHLDYPGTGYYLMPVIDGSTSFTLPDSSSITPSASSIRFDYEFTGLTVAVSPLNLVHTFGGFSPVVDPLTGALLSDEYYASVNGLVIATGDAAQAAYLVQLLTAGPDAFCDGSGQPITPNENYDPLLVTLQTLTIPIIDEYVITSCWDVHDAAGILYNIEVQNAKVPNSRVTLTITDPNASTTSTTVSAEPTVPTFTG